MASFRHGLVIGKLYPPHAGHALLVRSAADACERVTVIVLAHAVESIPLADRVAWVTHEHAGLPGVRVIGAVDDHPVDFEDPAVWDAHVRVLEAAVHRAVALDGRPAAEAVVDAVFSSEDYGAELARRFGATHVAVDPARRQAAVSGTAVRADVPGHWEHLAAPVRQALALRVVVLGAESTGTTTVARLLAEGLRSRGGAWSATGLVDEYGREYTVRRFAALQAARAHLGAGAPRLDDIAWTTDDFLAIAERQLAMEDAAAALGGPVLVCDTDAFATGVWHEYYLGARAPDVEAVGRRHPADLTLLTDPEGVPFEDDGWREGAHRRGWMTAVFAERLDAAGRPWVRLSGSVEERVARAAAEVDALCGRAWRYADPVTP